MFCSCLPEWVTHPTRKNTAWVGLASLHLLAQSVPHVLIREAMEQYRLGRVETHRGCLDAARAEKDPVVSAALRCAAYAVSHPMWSVAYARMAAERTILRCV